MNEVSDADRAVMRRQATALDACAPSGEAGASDRARLIEDSDAWRAAHGLSPLKTEVELHRRARDLGLLS
jgi:hypothetical protein